MPNLKRGPKHESCHLTWNRKWRKLGYCLPRGVRDGGGGGEVRGVRVVKEFDAEMKVSEGRKGTTLTGMTK